jgi:hypothetical protein
MNPSDFMPPTPKLTNYPVAISVTFGTLYTILLVLAIKYFDPTGGTLTISLMVVVSFLCVAVFCLFFTVPNDEITAAIIGGLVAAFGAVTSYWLTKR